MSHLRKNNLIQEFSELNALNKLQPKKDWDLIWVLSADQLDIKKEYLNERNETRERFETGIELVKAISSLRTGNKISSLSLNDIRRNGSKIYFSGYDNHNKLMSKYLEEGYFEKRYKIPRENIIIGLEENILHTDHQFEKFPDKLVAENKNIVVVTDAYHIPRVRRYHNKYSKKFSPVSFTFFPSKPFELSKKMISSEIKKIISYEKKGVFKKDPMIMIVGVTGSGGFIGSHLIRRLQSKEIKIKTLNRDGFKNREELEKFTAGCEVIFHLASPITNDKYILGQNSENTKNLLNALRKTELHCRVIFTSSFGVYKTPADTDVITEAYILSPRNEYGRFKLADEEIVKKYAVEKKLSSQILRISNVYGPEIKLNNHSVVANFIQRIKQDLPIIIDGDGKQTRDFVYIEDVIDALLLAMNSDNTQIINICSSEEISIANLVNALEGIIGKKAQVEYTQFKESEGFWNADNSLAKEVLGWEPKTFMREGLKLTVNSSK